MNKVEFIIMGGTFMALDDHYKDFFVRNLHDALSGNSSRNVQEAVKLVFFFFQTVCLFVE